jgi:2-dehydropantoate 2-reductase
VASAAGVAPLGFNGFQPQAFASGNATAIDASMRALHDYNAKAAKSHSGVWRDIVVRKRGTDVAAQLGPVQATGRKHGVPTPLVDWVVSTVQAVEAGRRHVGRALFSELRDLVEKKA